MPGSLWEKNSKQPPVSADGIPPPLNRSVLSFSFTLPGLILYKPHISHLLCFTITTEAFENPKRLSVISTNGRNFIFSDERSLTEFTLNERFFSRLRSFRMTK
jgi:hypothetical protein